MAVAAASTGCQSSGPDGAESATDAGACSSVPVDAAAALYPNDAGCISLLFLPCGLPAGATVDKCVVDVASCASVCPAPFLYCQLGPGSCVAGGTVADAAAFVDCVACPGVISGRRPLGMTGTAPAGAHGLGDYFASMALLEAASVRAFRDLRRALEAHAAPPRLASRARQAENDERRHARCVARLAKRFGGTPARWQGGASTIPGVLALLEDNAAEGCARESYGALVATFQARRAVDARVRRALDRIARDENRHAELAWSVLAWGWSLLRVEEQARVTAAFEAALEGLHARGRMRRSPEVRTIAGHPSQAEESALVSAFAAVARAQWRRHTACALAAR
jgi:hypothetical protein